MVVNGRRGSEIEKHKKTRNGVIYLAFGYEYFLMALHSAKTLKRTNPHIICELVTNLSLDHLNTEDSNPFDSVKTIKQEDKYNRLFKTNILEYASFDTGAFIDCDTEIKGSLDPVLSCLNRFDIAAKLNPNPTTKDYDIAAGIHGRFFPFWNCGVVFFKKNEKVKALFKKWYQIYRLEAKASDQPAFAKAVYENPDVKILSLNGIWNTFQGEDVIVLKYRKMSNMSVKWLKNSIIWHYRKSEQWPYVAPKLYRIHQDICSSIKSSNKSKSTEIDNIGRKYKIITLPFYRFIFNKPLFKRLFEFFLNGLAKFGIIKQIRLKREKHFIGTKYIHKESF